MGLKRAFAAVGVLGLALGLTSCSAPDPDPKRVDWVEVADQPIIALDASTGVYVIVGRYSATVDTQVDYRFASKMETGAIREDQIGAYIERYAADNDIPYYIEDEFVVDIYEDAAAESARFTVFQCDPEEAPNSSDYWSVYYPCVTEDGRKVGFRVELHVPEDTVIQEFSG